MQFQENISIKHFNSFGIDVRTKFFASFSSLDVLQELICVAKNPLILGGGSNVLFTKDYNGYILRNELRGIELIDEDADHYYIKAQAGENWHSFVLHCINQNYAGLEDPSLIPVSVGASPMQNIGAYGVEIKDVFHQLEALHIETGKVHVFGLSDCEFGYRESVFKKQFRNQFIILNVTYKLNKKPLFHTSYGAIEQELSKMNVQELSIQLISEAVIRIRSSKLPDPAVIGNAGSFFKNPVIAADQYYQLKKDFPQMPGYETGNHLIKLAAGWLIEQCNWKGYRKNDAGCYDKQALVLVNYGNATGNEIFNLSQSIIESVQNKFGVSLEREVNII